MNSGHDTRLPSLKTNRIAALLRRRCWERAGRGETTDRRVRRSACAVPWPYGAPALCDRLWFSSVRETRACVSAPNSRAAASWRTCKTSQPNVLDRGHSCRMVMAFSGLYPVLKAHYKRRVRGCQSRARASPAPVPGSPAAIPPGQSAYETCASLPGFLRRRRRILASAPDPSRRWR